MGWGSIIFVITTGTWVFKYLVSNSKTFCGDEAFFLIIRLLPNLERYVWNLKSCAEAKNDFIKYVAQNYNIFLCVSRCVFWEKNWWRKALKYTELLYQAAEYDTTFLLHAQRYAMTANLRDKEHLYFPSVSTESPTPMSARCGQVVRIDGWMDGDQKCPFISWFFFFKQNYMWTKDPQVLKMSKSILWVWYLDLKLGISIILQILT